MAVGGKIGVPLGGGTLGEGVPGVGSGGNETKGGGVGEGDGLGEKGTKTGCESCGVGVGDALATPVLPGRMKATSMAPMTSPMIASARAAMIGSRFSPDATARRLG
jgi:hypothetical protein